MKTHPHAEATYEVVPLADGEFGVKVMIPDSHPTTVTSFPSEAAAGAWIDSHKARVRAQSQPATIFRRARPPRPAQ